VNVASTTITTTAVPVSVGPSASASITAIAEPARDRDREWWARNGTDWSAVLDGARTLAAIAVGEIPMDDTLERACREADAKAAARPADARTLRARRLLADDVSYERAFGEFLRDRRRRRPSSTRWCSRCGAAWPN
jgi:hypothetical protein